MLASAVACSGGTGRSDLIASFMRDRDPQGQPRYSRAEAQCAADATLRILTKDQIHFLLAQSVQQLPAGVRARWGDAIKACLAASTPATLPSQATTTTTTSPSSPSSELSTSSTTSIPVTTAPTTLGPTPSATVTRPARPTSTIGRTPSTKAGG